MIKDPSKARGKDTLGRISQSKDVEIESVTTCPRSLEHLGRTQCEARSEEASGTNRGQIRGPLTHSRNLESLASNGEPREDEKQAGM